MKSKYYKGLNKSERHRISDALYRLRNQGFIIPDSEVKKIKDASSYKVIEQQAVKLRGAEYSPIKSSGKRQQPIPAKLGYELVQEHKKYEKERKKEIKKHGLKEEDIPEFSPKAIEPTATEKRYKRLTKKQVEEETLKRAKRNIKRMKKYSPAEIVAERTAQARKNVLKAMRTTVKPYSAKLYNMIRKSLNEMSSQEFLRFYDDVGRDAFDAMFIYQAGAFRLGIGEEEQPIYKFLDRLGIDINDEIYKGVTIHDFVETIS